MVLLENNSDYYNLIEFIAINNNIDPKSFEFNIKEIKCPITLEITNYSINFKCSHEFSCAIFTWLKTNNSCPVCREVIKLTRIRKNILIRLMNKVSKAILELFVEFINCLFNYIILPWLNAFICVIAFCFILTMFK